MKRVAAALPRGKTLPEDVWRRRHRAMVGLVWAHAVGLPLFALALGVPLWHALLEGVPVAGFALAASAPMFSRRVRSSMVAIGLLTASALLVHIWEGRIEAHFHFFVMVTILATYEEWFPYLLGVAYVVVHHGLAGGLLPESVYDHAQAIADPWKWAGIHGLFIAALGVANIVGWRMNEDLRSEHSKAHERMQNAFDDAPIGMALVAPDGRFLNVNGELSRLTGYEREQLLAMRFEDVVDEDGSGDEHRFRRADGSVGWGLWKHTFVDGPEPYYVTQCLDVSRRKQAENELAFRAHHDPLTGLPNRTQFVEQLEATLEQDERVAVMFIDVDDFKLINDSLGHGAGDRLLIAVGDRLRRVIRPGDVLARFGGDEFSVCLSDVADERAAQRAAERVSATLRAPFLLDGQQRFITGSIGIKMADGRATAEELLADADAAMYRAKELGKARSEVFDETMRARVVERLELETGLREAIDRGELRLVYQPQVRLSDGEVAGVEALLRWDHRRLGVVSPDRFIPIAERTGLILPIGQWVLAEACRQLRAWDDAGVVGAGGLVMSVNVSPRQLVTDGLVDQVAAVLRDTGIDPGRLCLEVTESAVIADPDAALASLHALKQLGVRLAIDDFGTGYSSLGNLRDLLPVDALKIDRSFIDGMPERDDDRAIVESVVSLAGSLGLVTVAEGVETEAHVDLLLEMGCSHAQGYHYARPAPPEELAALLVELPRAA
jgi:diguanylate cyclase (GGDEF)-like protein